MITWLIGNTGAGKTTFAEKLRKMSGENCIVLDGDEMRKVWTDLSLEKQDRREQNLRLARLAVNLHAQGFYIIVASICPFNDLRREVKAITGCMFMYLEGGHPVDSEHPFEIPLDADFVVKRREKV